MTTIHLRTLYRAIDLISAVPDPVEARTRLVALVNRRLADPGLRHARDPANTPKDSGDLIGSLAVLPARVVGNVVEGALLVGVDYGKLQEFRHRTKGNYLKRSVEQVLRALEEDVGGDLVLARLGVRLAGRRGG